MPVAIAPDDTSTTSAPRSCAAARASTSGPIWPALSPLIDDEPTFTTMRRAFGMSARLRGSPLASRRRSVTSSLRRLAGASTGGRRPRRSLDGDVVGPEAGLALALQFGAGLGLRVHALVVVARGARRGWRAGCRRGGASVPRGAVMSSAVEVRVGSQSKTTPDARADDDGRAGDRAGANELRPRRRACARRSARKPTASSFVKSVCCTQRSGFAPSTR